MELWLVGAVCFCSFVGWNCVDVSCTGGCLSGQVLLLFAWGVL